MSRAAVVYIVMLLVCMAGLWSIIHVGVALRAPVDLSGTWVVGGEDPAVARQLGDTVDVEQSGQFFRLNFQHGLRVDLKLKDQITPDPASNRKLDMLFEGPKWKLTAFGAASSGPLIFRLTGPDKHAFTVTRGPAAPGGSSASASPPTETADAGTDAP